MIKRLHSTPAEPLHRSRVDSERCRALATHLVNHPTLECLDLSYNFIGDRGARALAKLIGGGSPTSLRTLILTSNRLQATGGLAMAHALAKPTCQLVRLNLRLNRLADDGGVAIAKAREVVVAFAAGLFIDDCCSDVLCFVWFVCITIESDAKPIPTGVESGCDRFGRKFGNLFRLRAQPQQDTDRIGPLEQPTGRGELCVSTSI